MKPDRSGAEIALALVVALLFLPVSIAWHAVVLRQLWAWFVVPAFGAPVPGFAVACGLCVVLGWLKHRKATKEEREEDVVDAFARTVASNVFFPAWVLALGFVVSRFL